VSKSENALVHVNRAIKKIPQHAFFFADLGFTCIPIDRVYDLLNLFPKAFSCEQASIPNRLDASKFERFSFACAVWTSLLPKRATVDHDSFVLGQQGAVSRFPASILWIKNWPVHRPDWKLAVSRLINKFSILPSQRDLRTTSAPMPHRWWRTAAMNGRSGAKKWV